MKNIPLLVALIITAGSIRAYSQDVELGNWAKDIDPSKITPHNDLGIQVPPIAPTGIFSFPTATRMASTYIETTVTGKGSGSKTLHRDILSRGSEYAVIAFSAAELEAGKDAIANAKGICADKKGVIVSPKDSDGKDLYDQWSPPFGDTDEREAMEKRFSFVTIGKCSSYDLGAPLWLHVSCEAEAKLVCAVK